MPEQSERPRLVKILRWLIFTEIALAALTILGNLTQNQFLPPLLQQYHESLSVDRPPPPDNLPDATVLLVRSGLMFIAEVALLVVGVVAMVLLWRGHRLGRRLYTVGWVACVPLALLTGPVVEMPWVTFNELLTNVVGGMILCLLYFTDLRFLYQPPQPQ